MSTDTATTTPAIATGTYMIDPSHSEVGFVARHAMITKVRGAFRTFEGTGYFDQKNPSNSHLKLDILADSIDTGNADRDGHLRGNDFFDMENHPRITFASTSIEAAGHDTYRVTGDLSLRGVTKPVVVEFEFAGTAIDPFGNHRMGLEGSVVVNRKDWGLNYNAALDTGGVLVGEKVTLNFDVSAIKTD